MGILVKQILGKFDELSFLEALPVDLKLDNKMVDDLKVDWQEIGNPIDVLKQPGDPFKGLQIRLVQIPSEIIHETVKLRDLPNNQRFLLGELLGEDLNGLGENILAILVELLDSSVIGVDHRFLDIKLSCKIIINCIDLLFYCFIVNIVPY